MNGENKALYTSMKTCNLIVSAVSVILGSLIVYFSMQLGVGPSKSTGMKAGTWSCIMGCGILIFAIILLFYTLKNAKKLGDIDLCNEHGEYVNRVSICLPQNKPVYLVMLTAIVFSVCLKYLGIYISGAVLLPALMWLLMPDEQKKDKKKAVIKMLLIDICVIAAIYVIFELGLKARLPEPFWM